MNNLENIKTILARNNYQVTAIATDNGCLVIYPARMETPVTFITRVQCEYTESGLRVIISDELGEIHKDITYKCPIYAQRLLMLCYLVARCITIEYTPSLIVFIHEENEVDEDTFYQSCNNGLITQNELALEAELRPIIVQCMHTIFTPQQEEIARDKNVLDGFIIIRDLIIGKGKNGEEENTMDGRS